MDDHPEAGFTFGRAITTDKPDFRNHRAAGSCRSTVLGGADFWERSCAQASNLVSTPTAVVRTRLQHEIGGYRAELPHTGDLEMWMRFAAHAPVGVLDADQAFYRVHGHNMHVDTLRAVALGAVHAAGKLFERGDAASCERLLQEAVRVFPEVRGEREWSRLRWKRLLGRGVLKAVRRVRHALRKPAPVDRSPFGRCGVFEGV
jgi:hypothetical protein